MQMLVYMAIRTDLPGGRGTEYDNLNTHGLILIIYKYCYERSGCAKQAEDVAIILGIILSLFFSLSELSVQSPKKSFLINEILGFWPE